MKLTKPALILLLWLGLFGLAELYGPVEAAAYVFLFLSAFLIYKYVSKLYLEQWKIFFKLPSIRRTTSL